MKQALEKFIRAQEAENTPAYIYDAQTVMHRAHALKQCFGGLFNISYALKSNPNQRLVNLISKQVGYLDASSYAEAARALKTGIAPGRISYSGPGKRPAELAGVLGSGVVLVVEALDEIAQIAAIAEQANEKQDIVLRINPDYVPKSFGASMAGSASQFGVDQSQMAKAIDAVKAAPHLNLIGFHIYTGSNSLNAEGIADNLLNMAKVFRLAVTHAEIKPRKLIFGAGFGLPYHVGQEPLDIDAVRDLVVGDIAKLSSDFPDTALILELGRWLVGPAGALVSRVLSRKNSNGTEVAICDAGFNNHLAACGMMGAVFQKNWPIKNLTNTSGAVSEFKITGPLCTSIDSIARKIDLPELRRGDLISIGMSGAYGLTASPVRFISHPEPKELLFFDDNFEDISEAAQSAPPETLSQVVNYQNERRPV